MRYAPEMGRYARLIVAASGLCLAGCAATVLRPSYACMRIGLNEELEAAAQRSAQEFDALMKARTDAGTCIPLATGQRVIIGSVTMSGAWVGVMPPGGANDPFGYLWTRAEVVNERKLPPRPPP